uniref:Cilia and flagella associated protein 58 n=1 Tax=Athene cunicularia TaxID=194338 RepID=A0A663MIC3_ATHCN
EKDFQEVINLLKGDKTLEKFRIEYEKLHAVMKKSHENENRLMEKCKELNAELVVNSSKVAVLTKLSKDDQGTISSMKTELEKAWKMVDTAYGKEQKAKETINSLQEEISRLSNLVEQESGLSLGWEHNIQDLLKLKEEITKERDQLLSEVVKLRQSLTQATEQQQDAERAKNEADQSIMQLQQEIQLHQNEASREARMKEKMEKDLKNLLAEVDNKEAEIKNLQQHIQRNKEEQLNMEQHLKDQKILNEKAGKELEQLQMRNNKLMQESEQHRVMFKEVMQDIQQKTAELKVSTRRYTHPISHMTLMANKLSVAEEQKVNAGHERNTLKNQISGLERDLEAAKKQAEIDKRAVDELMRERDMLSKNLVKATSATQKQIGLVKLHEQSKKNLEGEIQGYKNEAQKQRNIIYQLEKERDCFINDNNELKQKVLQHLKDLEMREMQICDYEKKIEESGIKLKQQQNHCEAVRTEKNLYRKNLIEAKDEIAEMKEKLKTLTHQVDQLKEEITDKEAALVKEKEKLYVELKHILARQPGPEAAKQLQLYRHNLREKTKQLKVLSSELNMYESQSQEHKHEIERLAKELLNVKKKYLAQKRKEQQAKYGKRTVLSTQFSA